MLGAWLWAAGCDGAADCASGFARAVDGNCYPIVGIVQSSDAETSADPTTDTDGDGLSDAEEEALGTSIFLTDTDGDGLDDGEEASHGADPLVVDTDGDGYTDGDEVHEGADPADAADRIYQGHWPYHADKGAIPAPPPGPARAGDRFARLQLVDQYGEVVDLYDFYNADKPVVIEISAVWCGPCRDLSTWVSGGSSVLFEGVWPDGPDAIARGDVYWLTVLTQDLDGDPPEPADAASWHADYPTPMVPVLADEAGFVEPYTDTSSWPSAWLLEPDLTIVDMDRDVTEVMSELDARLR